MSLLESIRTPKDLRALTKRQLILLADEIRGFLVTKVSRTGGHLGPNLGVVELTIGLHRVFDSPKDPIIFDTGHQSYVHKLLTGRSGGFDGLRQSGGLSGYPSRAESEHDWVENSHASTSLSWGEGLAKGFKLRGEDRTVVVVVGDGALTGGMAWEALNNIATRDDLRIVIVVNDNGRSYTPTVGGLAKHLAALRTDKRYERTLSFIKRRVTGMPVMGRPVYDLLHGFKTGVKDVLAPQGMFSDLGIKYTGPIDGHDIGAVISHLEAARQYGGPVIVHAMTRKGKGFRAAEENEEDRFHAVGKINEFTGEPLSAAVQATWTDAFAEAMVQIGRRRPDVVAITAAMLNPTGLGRFAAAFPDRTFDVGIAEQHAVVSAAGLAAAGMHPVVALYATFVNRAFDQVLMDAGLHGLGVTFALDRSGITGTDGASHNGMWDISLLGLVPGLEIASPRDQTRLVDALERSVSIDDRPTVVRYSKERLPDALPAVTQRGSGRDQVDILRLDQSPSVLVVGYGQFAGIGMEVASRLAKQGFASTVADPLWCVPVSPELVSLVAEHELAVSIEDNLLQGGLGERLRAELAAAGVDVPVMAFGIPQSYLAHGSRDEVLEAVGLNSKDIARRVLERVLTGSDSSGDLQEQRLEELDLPGTGAAPSE
ncbi:1-deoxy-D-xylulose-5-phosphate synthase [Tessaracoccus sp. OS52]|uniref:1-deoxy-D-xylulose-5-phosphate synthase n=1 Tax=Tessaracoccus sp. OS52 TaxID=2886691 RepID=UPI001D106621|nr:1-deoxy-D-xylulose-5-phosphate synthase [Tessaracoccus sp. OS52]MCC2592832.1 1-deoxy-D-xylulose-5-phosphate synthase [Tessaracoccus sp. OS52]